MFIIASSLEMGGNYVLLTGWNLFGSTLFSLFGGVKNEAMQYLEAKMCAIKTKTIAYVRILRVYIVIVNKYIFIITSALEMREK